MTRLTPPPSGGFTLYHSPFLAYLTDFDRVFDYLLIIKARSSLFRTIFIRPHISVPKKTKSGANVTNTNFGLVWPIWIWFFTFFYLFRLYLPTLWHCLCVRISQSSPKPAPPSRKNYFTYCKFFFLHLWASKPPSKYVIGKFSCARISEPKKRAFPEIVTHRIFSKIDRFWSDFCNLLLIQAISSYLVPF